MCFDVTLFVHSIFVVKIHVDTVIEQRMLCSLSCESFNLQKHHTHAHTHSHTHTHTHTHIYIYIYI